MDGEKHWKALAFFPKNNANTNSQPIPSACTFHTRSLPCPHSQTHPHNKQTTSTTVFYTDKQQRRSKQVAYSLYSIPVTFDTSHDLKSLLKEMALKNTTKQRRKKK